jgi:hypothetical protein
VRLIDRYQLAGIRASTPIENVSDDEYFEDFTQGTQSTSTPFLPRSIAITHRDDIWNLRAEVVGFQTLDDTLPVDERPYIQLPRLTAAGFGRRRTGAAADWIRRRTGQFHARRLRGCGAMRRRPPASPPTPLNVSGWRLDAKPQVGLDISGPGLLFPAQCRPGSSPSTRCAMPAGATSSPERSLPIVSIDSGLSSSV